MEEAVVALENATLRGDSSRELASLVEQLAAAVVNYEALSMPASTP